MKYRLLASLGLLLAFTVAAADPIIYIPELKPMTIEWDHDRRVSSSDTYYRFYVGTNLLQQITTNDFRIVATNTDGLCVIRALLVFPHDLVGPNATNLLTVTAVDPVVDSVTGQESGPSTNTLIGQVVGKPLPPQGTRNP